MTSLQAGGLVIKIENGAAYILLVRSRETPDHWIFPKGHVEPDETPTEAAAREVKEEAGVRGVVLSPLEPVLEFPSGRSQVRVRVRYYLIAATHDGPSPERREKKWLEPAEALVQLSFDDARGLLRAALPTIERLVAGAPPGDEGFRELLLAEYAHTADSLLRNEEDGEKRVTFLITISGGVAAALGLVFGDAPWLPPDLRRPLVIAALAVLCGLGYLTLLRVVARNAASDRYKRGLNRIRRYFLRGIDDPGLVFLPFNPWRVEDRPRTYGFGKGGWLPTVVFVDALLLGALAAMLVESPSWFTHAAVGVGAAILAWLLLTAVAHRKYVAASQD